MRLFWIPVFLFLAFFFISQNSPKVRIIHADLNLGRKIKGEQLRILKGNVHVIRDTVHLFCDSAKYFENRDQLDLYGNVVINTGKRTLNALKVQYYPNIEVAKCYGKVRASSRKDSLYSHYLEYNFKSEESNAVDSVYMLSKTDQAIIRGKRSYYNQKSGYLKITEDAVFQQIDTAGTDTFKVLSHILEYYGDTLDYALAVDSVKLRQGTMRAKADSVWYYLKKEQAWLKGNPVVWIEKSELKGNKILAEFDSTKIKHLFVYENAQAKTLNDSVKNEYNLLIGKTIEFFIENKEPTLVIARNNAKSIYYLSEGADKGSNYSTSDSIFVYFEDGKPDSIKIIGGSEGIYYPDTYKGERKFEH